MQRKPFFFASALVAAAALASAAMPALAEGPIETVLHTPNVAAERASTLTRAEVLAEAERARKSGANRVYSTSFNPFTEATLQRQRDAVRTEARMTQLRSQAVPETGSLALHGEDSGSFALARAMQVEATTRLLARR